MQDIRIAVVEDDQYLASWICDHLITYGYQIPFMTNSGKQAIETILHSEATAIPDLILMDINFESNKNVGESDDGIAAAEYIHEKYGIPIIFITGYNDSITLNRAKQSGAFGFIVKPVDENQLHFTIELTLSKSRELIEARRREQELAKAFVDGQDQERIRLATELHEEIGTNLSAISQMLSYLEDPSFTDIKARIARVRVSREEINRVIQSVRILSSELAPPSLTELGLKSAVKSYVEMVRYKNPDLLIELDLDAITSIQAQLSPSIQLSIYRIVVELINNIYDHSYAKTANCSFLLSKNILNFIVEDDGIGFDPNSNFIGNGFRSIYARLNVLNGSVQIESDPNLSSGCFISVQIPLNTLIS